MHFFRIYKYFYLTGVLTLTVISLIQLVQTFKPYIEKYKKIHPTLRKHAEKIVLPIAKRILKKGLRANLGLMILIALMYLSLVAINYFIFWKIK